MQRTLVIAVSALLLSAGAGARVFPPVPSTATNPERALPNDNRVAAGSIANGELTVALELRATTWMPNGDSGVAIPIAAFAESGKAPSIPGPLLRVSAGTRVRATIRNLLGVRAVVRGLRDHDGAVDSLVLGPGEARDVRFTARAVGTHFYFARTTPDTTSMTRGADSQLAGALIVDPPDSEGVPHAVHDRVFVITAWEDTIRDARMRYGRPQLFAINGMSWPHTERLSYTVGDSIRWRVINASQHGHPMHLHGFFFQVLSHGTTLEDTVYAAEARRNAVTELTTPATTMSMQWAPDRAGNWLYHCHFINHVDTQIRLADAPAPAIRAGTTHIAGAMSGLVMAITVRDTAAAVARRLASPRRRLRLFVTERAGPSGGLPSYSYVLQRGPREPASDSTQLPGSALVLHRREPTEITVINRTRHATAVHWHGMELESYYDGVAGWSGADALTAPMIAPGDSFVARMTPPRAGTFIYHTHADDLTQMTGGLYGALLVLPEHGNPDPTERVIIFSDSSAADMRETPPPLINGSSAPAPIALCTGVAHRLRLIGISAVSGRRLRLLDDTAPASWTLLAKDGQELPRVQRITKDASGRLVPGETMDVAFTPPHAGTYVLEATSAYNTPRVLRLPLVAAACETHGTARGS